MTAKEKPRPTAVIFDYGVGNIHSLRKGLTLAGADVEVTDRPDDLVDPAIAVLPGVGAFGHVMESLEPARDILRERHERGHPVLGVCIGMQALHEGSEEAPDVPGLGIMPGRHRRLSAGQKVPHMGWNNLSVARPTGPAETTAKKHPLRHSLAEAGYVYYVHSYAAPVTSQTIATTTYTDRFAAAVRDNNTVGFQFHPEKSSDAGKRILAATVATLAAAWEATQ